MLLINRMEEKQLNFAKPLLSVRRFPSGATLGNDTKRKIDKSRPSAPQPPRYQSELKSGPVRNPGTVPFMWEQSPGLPKDETEHKVRVVDNQPKFPEGRSPKVNQQNLDLSICKNQTGCTQLFDEESEQSGFPKDEIDKEGSSRSGDEENEEYVDARCTLSRTESFFINCSISGLEDSDTRVSEHSLIDPQTRDLMMGRFLPAALAMTSESPQHAHWKLPVVSQQLNQLKLTNDKMHPRLRYGTNSVPGYSGYHDNEDADSEADYEEHENFPSQVCGILPRLGLRSSVFFGSPLRGTSVRTLAPASPFRKSQTVLSSSGSCQDDAKISSDCLELKLQICKKELKNHGNIHPCTESISAYRQSEVGNIPADGYGVTVNCNGSVQYKAPCRTPEEAKDPKGDGLEMNITVHRTFNELLAEENRSSELDAESPEAEKTVFVVSHHKVEPPTFKSLDSDMEAKLDGSKHQYLMEKTNRNPILESSIKDIDKLSIIKKGAKQDQLPDLHVKSSTNKENSNLRSGMSKSLYRENDRYKSLRSSQHEFRSSPPGLAKLENHLELPFPPPLPKTPSDSWLGRTLPSVSGKNGSVYRKLMSGASPKHQVLELKSSSPKWETIVKMTKVQEQHFHYSKERLRAIPEA